MIMCVCAHVCVLCVSLFNTVLVNFEPAHYSNTELWVKSIKGK